MRLDVGMLEQLLQKCATYIKPYEKYSSVIYKDSVGIPTIGYGCTDPAVIKEYKFSTMSKDDAEYYLKCHIKNEVIDRILPLIKPTLSIEQLVPIVDLVYNIGIGNFEKSPLLKALNNQGNINDIANGFIYHDKAKGGKYIRGLLNRRLYELYYFKYRRASRINFYKLTEDEVQDYVANIKNGQLPF